MLFIYLAGSDAKLLSLAELGGVRNYRLLFRIGSKIVNLTPLRFLFAIKFQTLDKIFLLYIELMLNTCLGVLGWHFFLKALQVSFYLRAKWQFV